MGLVQALTSPSLAGAPSTPCQEDHAAHAQPHQDLALIVQITLMAQNMRTAGARVMDGGQRALMVQVLKVSRDHIEVQSILLGTAAKAHRMEAATSVHRSHSSAMMILGMRSVLVTDVYANVP